MNDLIDRIIAAQVPGVVQGAALRLKESAASLESVFNMKSTRLLRSPKTTIAALIRVFGPAVAAVEEIGELTLPGDLREECAVLVESKGPAVVQDVLRQAREKVTALEQDHSSLPFFGYFLKVERELPYSTLFAVAHTLRLTESLPVLSNLMAQLEAPAFDADSSAEERARTSLEWASRVVKNIYLPFGVGPVAVIESILSGRSLHKQDGGQALAAVNHSLKDFPHTPNLRSDLAILRNGESHPVTGFDVQVDGSAVLKDKNKPPLQLTAAECDQIGKAAIQETARILVALGVVAWWRLAEDVAVSNIIEIIAAGIRGKEPAELVSQMDSLGADTELRLLKLGLLSADESAAPAGGQTASR